MCVESAGTSEKLASGVTCAVPAGSGVASLGTCRPEDAVGHVANKADVTNLAMGLTPTAPFVVGFFLLACLSYSCWLSQCLNVQASLLHVLGPPRSADRHGLWKWQGFLPCWFLLDLPDFGLLLDLELLLDIGATATAARLSSWAHSPFDRFLSCSRSCLGFGLGCVFGWWAWRASVGPPMEPREPTMLLDMGSVARNLP